MVRGEKTPTNIYMEEGARIHDIIASKRLKLIPIISDSAIYEDIVPDKKKWVNYFKVPVFDWLDVSMVVDVLDPKNKLIVDWKTGRGKSTEYNKLQVYIYAYLLGKEGIDIKYGVMAKVREDLSGAILCTDYSIYKITPEKLELAENYIESNASEIYSFLQESEKEAAEAEDR